MEYQKREKFILLPTEEISKIVSVAGHRYAYFHSMAHADGSCWSMDVKTMQIPHRRKTQQSSTANFETLSLPKN